MRALLFTVSVLIFSAAIPTAPATSSNFDQLTSPLFPRTQSYPVSLSLAAMLLVPGRKLRIVAYARYSTDEQNPRSIDDQFQKIRQFLKKEGLEDCEVIEITDEGISGRRRNRPGIDRLMELIKSKQCDVIVTEDPSRLFRKTQFLLELFAIAKDADIRILTVDAGIDTNNDSWRLITPIHAVIAETFLEQTSARIRRGAEGRWYAKFAVNTVLPGYRRVPSNPNADDPRKRGPYRDERDQQWTPVIVEAFERAAVGQSLWEIAQFFSKMSFPLPCRARSNKWTDVLVRRMLQNSTYMGLELYRITQSRPLEVSGMVRQIKSKEEDVLRRSMPHLAHVSESLWQKANEAIRARRRHNHYSRGLDHPNTGTPRDRWGPLSNVFYCGVCGARMHRDGAGYRCSASKKRWTLAQRDHERCWNRCSPQPAVVHANIGSAIIDAMLRRACFVEDLKPVIDRMSQDGDGSREARIRYLHREKDRLSKAIERLGEVIETASDLSSMVDQLRKREGELACVNRDLLELQQQAPEEIPLPSREEILTEIEKIKPLLLEKLGREAGAVLRQLVDRIEARPYKSIDSDRIILRAHFELNLVKLLPAQWQFFLERHAGSLPSIELDSMLIIPVVVDLFERPQFVQHAWEVLTMTELGATLKEIAKSLGVTLDTAKSAKRAALLMRTKALDDFYIPLAQRPAKLSPRWRSDPPETKGGQDQEKNDGRPDEELRKTV